MPCCAEPHNLCPKQAAGRAGSRGKKTCRPQLGPAPPQLTMQWLRATSALVRQNGSSAVQPESCRYPALSFLQGAHMPATHWEVPGQTQLEEQGAPISGPHNSCRRGCRHVAGWEVH